MCVGGYILLGGNAYTRYSIVVVGRNSGICYACNLEITFCHYQIPSINNTECRSLLMLVQYWIGGCGQGPHTPPQCPSSRQG